MASLFVNCWNIQCPGQLRVECRETDQALFCPICSTVGTFINIGYFTCKKCSSTIKALLQYGVLRGEDLRCMNCHTHVVGSQPLRIFTLEQHFRDKGEKFDISYCGRNYFSDLEDEVTIGRSAVASIESRRKSWKIFGKTAAPPPKNIIYVRRLASIKIDSLRVPVSIQTYHAYCNFKHDPSHENAKLHGALAHFGEGSVIDLLCKKREIEMWFSNEQAKLEFETQPRLKKYFTNFHVL